jgi:SWI/SNF-related matrix-associated actin-dependent regulator of chromatin subfamily A-like protein 1
MSENARSDSTEISKQQTPNNLLNANPANPFLVDINTLNSLGSGNKNMFIPNSSSENKKQRKSLKPKKTGNEVIMDEFIKNEEDLGSESDSENESEDKFLNEFFNRFKDGKNLRRLITTRRNVYCQLISTKEFALELDFTPESFILDIITSNGGKLDHDTSLYFAPYSNYQKTLEDFDNIEKMSEKVNLYPIAEITNKLLNKINYSEISFRMNRNVKRIKIDYNDEVPKSLEELPDEVLKGLYPFQKDGIEFAIKNHARILLADEMGVGKTIQSVCIAGLYTEDWPVLVICPSAVKTCWKNEILIWLKHIVDESDIFIVKSSKNKLKKAKFYICTYDLATRISDKLKKFKFQFCIADECHSLKNMQSKRYEKLMPILRQSKRLLLLSGTPILAKPVEAFHVVHALRPDIFTRFKPFGDRYCDPKPTQFGIDWSGQANTKELHFLMSTLMIRRLKKNVISELPPKKRQKVELHCETDIVAKVRKYLNSRFQKELEKEKADRGELTEKDKEEKAERKKKEELEEKLTFAEAYSLTGLAKLKGIKDYIKYLLENNCKFIIYAYHIAVLDSIEDLLIEFEVGYIRIDGRVLNEKRDEAVAQFQEDETCKVALLGITACATGINLTAASTILFAELYWTPAIMIQAEDRAHRIGQQHPCVNIHYLYGADTIDEIIFPRLREKYFVVSTTLDDQKLELGLQPVESGVVGDFSNSNKKIISQKKIIIDDEEEDFQEFKKEIENNYGLIVDKNEIEKSIDEDLFSKLNLHDGGVKRERDLDSVEENDETNFSLQEKEISFFSKSSSKTKFGNSSDL